MRGGGFLFLVSLALFWPCIISFIFLLHLTITLCLPLDVQNLYRWDNLEVDGICGNQTVLCSSVRPFRYITINLAQMLRRFPINPFFNALKKGVYKVFKKKMTAVSNTRFSDTFLIQLFYFM